MPTYYKLLKPDLRHYGFTYTEGLNVLKQPFNPDSMCGEGGLYFSDLDNIFKWLYIYDYNPDLLIACVCLPEDAQIVFIDTYGRKKYKSNKILLSNIQRLDNLISSDKDICIKAVKQNGSIFKYVKEQTEKMCMEAVKQNGYVLKYVKNKTEDICIQAVKQDRFALRYVDSCFYDICSKIENAL